MNPAEVQALVEAIQLLEPEIQKGIVALVHLIPHAKTVADYAAAAQKLLAQAAALMPPAPSTPAS